MKILLFNTIVNLLIITFIIILLGFLINLLFMLITFNKKDLRYAPIDPIMTKTVTQILKTIKLPYSTLRILDIGSGDLSAILSFYKTIPDKIEILAGVEINPWLYYLSKLKLFIYKVLFRIMGKKSPNIIVIKANAFSLPKTFYTKFNVIFLYSLIVKNKFFATKIIPKIPKGTILISVLFPITKTNKLKLEKIVTTISGKIYVYKKYKTISITKKQ